MHFDLDQINYKLSDYVKQIQILDQSEEKLQSWFEIDKSNN